MRSVLLLALIGAVALGLVGVALISGSTVTACPPGYYAQPAYGGTYGTAGAYGAPPMRPMTAAVIGAYDDYFGPQRIDVQPGATVRGVNYGRHPHTPTA